VFRGEAKKAEFPRFYQSDVKLWLQNEGVKDVCCWIVGNRLIFLVSPKSPPNWIGQMPGFKDFVDEAMKTEVNLQKLFDLDLNSIQRLPDFHFE
jgi:hypothetical protein